MYFILPPVMTSFYAEKLSAKQASISLAQG